jgi:hypothetical protein
MGPPSPSRPNENRYGLAGKSVLYLCTSEEGVRREVNMSGGKSLYLQRFIIPGTVNLGDFRDLDEVDFLNDAFMFAEMANRDPVSHATMLFTQVLASLVSERFDGMIVPGVMGDVSTRYCNIVIFESAAWRMWLDPRWPSPTVAPR